MALALVSGQVEGANANHDHIELTFDAGTTAGNFVAVWAANNSHDQAAGQITDDKSGGSSSYNLDVHGIEYTQYVGIFSTLNCASGITTVYYQWDATTHYVGLVIAEFSGVATSSAVETDCCSKGFIAAGSPKHYHLAANSTAADLIFGGGMSNGDQGTVAGASGTEVLKIVAAGGNYGIQTFYKVQSAAGADTLDWTETASINTLTFAIAAYKPAAGGGGSATPTGNAGRMAATLGKSINVGRTHTGRI